MNFNKIDIENECEKIKLNNPDKLEALQEINKFYEGLVIKKLHETNYIRSLQIICLKKIHKIVKKKAKK